MLRSALGVLVLLGGCMGDELALPEGDVEQGKQAFVELQCNTCHSVGDIEQVAGGASPPIAKELGGEVTRVKSYPDLVTSIINPSHRLSARFPQDMTAEIADEHGKSRMPSYNDVMTVQELVNIVTFLQTQYQVRVPRRDYPMYY